MRATNCNWAAASLSLLFSASTNDNRCWLHQPSAPVAQRTQADGWYLPTIALHRPHCRSPARSHSAQLPAPRGQGLCADLWVGLRCTAAPLPHVGPLVFALRLALGLSPTCASLGGILPVVLLLGERPSPGARCPARLAGGLGRHLRDSDRLRAFTRGNDK